MAPTDPQAPIEGDEKATETPRPGVAEEGPFTLDLGETNWGLETAELERTAGGTLRPMRRRPMRFATADDAELARIEASQRRERRSLRSSFGRLDAVIRTAGREKATVGLPPAPGAVLRVLEAYGFDAQAREVDFDRLRAPGVDVEEAARVIGAGTRRLTLPVDWRTRDHGHFVGSYAPRVDDGPGGGLKVVGDDRPVALIRRPGLGYVMKPPGDGPAIRVTDEIAAKISPYATEVAPPLPRDGAGFGAIARHVLPMARRELVWAGMLGALSGAVGAITPIVTGVIVDQLIPAQETGLIIQIGVGLLMAAMLGLFFSVTRQTMLLRLGGRAAMLVDAALWRRVLDLPSAFFRRYASGDLRSRIEGFGALREAVISVALSAGITATFSIFYLGLLFAYDARLALVAVALVLLLAAATAVVSILQLKHHRREAELSGWLGGYVFQILRAIVKLRVAGAEDRAFVRWADKFAEAQAVSLASERLSNHFAAFSELYRTLTMAALFAGAYHLSAERPSPGVFIAFLAAFGGFQSAFNGLSGAALTLVNTLPDWRRALPLFEAHPEAISGAADPGRLEGEIEVMGVSFAYPDGPLILKDVSLQIGARDYVAIVGPSGSGKSTLVRLLLGLDRPNSGAVLFDGQELDGLDLTAVRRQIGVVTQSGSLSAGTILDNIRGATDATQEQCYEACWAAGFGQDLEQLPMGLQTPLTEGAPTLSGGQRQRLMIARALVNQPRILIFDEATSALDNRTQAMVAESVDRLDVTRIVIAHRLSTIRNANRIHVMQDGRIVESGTYDELMALDGVFAALAARQLA